MSLCIYVFKKVKYFVPKLLPGTITGAANDNNETPLFTRRASYTVEAAIVIPLVAVFLVTILFMFRVLQVQTDVQKALTYAGRTGAVSSKELSLGIAEAVFRFKLKDSHAVKTYVKNGGSGVSTLGSKIDGDYMRLQAACRIQVPFGVFGLSDIQIVVESKNRLWTGSTEGASGDPIVYYTPTGKVYHRTKSCPYLDLTIRSADFGRLEVLRNKSGHKYYACSDCALGQEPVQQVFITDYGTAYHTKLGCPGLKRTILELHLSEAGSRPACSKCGG